MDDLLLIAKILGHYGLQGGLKLDIYYKINFKFFVNKVFFIKDGAKFRSVILLKFEIFKQTVVIWFKDLNDLNSTSLFINKELFVGKTMQMPINKQINKIEIGAKVFYKNLLFGEVVEIINLKPHLVLRIKLISDSNKTILIPNVEEFIETRIVNNNLLLKKIQ